MKKTLLLMAAAFMATAASAQGLNFENAESVFSIAPSTSGLSENTATVNMSVAAISNMILVCEGNADGNITVINAADGTKLMAVPMAMATGSICNDDAGNVVAINYTPAGETANIYYQGDIMSQPTLLHSFVNNTDLAIGYKMSVTGSVTGDAAIVIVNEGVANVTTSSRFTLVTVKGGEVTSVEVKDATASGLSWGAAPANIAGIAAATADPANGFYITYYSPGLYFVDGACTTATPLFNPDSTGWGCNPNIIDVKTINGVPYLATASASYFNYFNGEFYVHDATVANAPVEKYKSTMGDYTAPATAGVATGAITMIADAKNFVAYVVAIEHASDLMRCVKVPFAESTAVENIEVSENAPAVYYNLQGVQVENPANGLFIVKQGKKVTKQYIK